MSREPLMLVAAVGSRLLTRPAAYAANDFTWGPVRELGLLFLGRP